ncbi:MAG: NOL1/NOP2/sun family putative RNA methylase [Planctomycetota bacterium]
MLGAIIVSEENVVHELPEPFRRRLEDIVPANRFDGCWASFSQRPATIFRVNTLKDSVETVCSELEEQGFLLAALPWKADAFRVPDEQRRALTESAAFAAGRIYIQNPSSMVPPLVLDPQPGEEVLDLAAAPGGKTLQMAAMMGNEGRIGAVEAVRGRFFRLRDNIMRAGVENVQTYLKDGAGVWRQCPERFDRVLLDAPCTGEGLFQVHNERSFAYWSEKKIAEMVRKQRRLLKSAIHCLKPGGVLVYSTCTFAPEENEAIVSRALAKFAGALEVEEIELQLDAMEPGLEAWKNKSFDPALRLARRIIPDGVMEGFFVCKLRKLETTL